MKLLYFDDFKLGVLKGDNVVDVSAVVEDIPHSGPGDLMNGLIARFDEYRSKLEAAPRPARAFPCDRCTFAPRCPSLPTSIAWP